MTTDVRKEDPDRKAAILRAAVDEVTRAGIDGMSIKDIAETAGVSTGLVMYYFKTKDELITAAWMEMVRHFYQRTTTEAGEDAGLRFFLNHFRVLFPDRDESTPPWSFWLEYWAKTARSDDLRLLHIERVKNLRSGFTRLVTNAADKAELRSDLDPELVGDLLHALVYGLAVKVSVDAEIISAERAYEIGELVVSLLRRDPSDA
jgi:AcrR family transcriptional regulator